MNTPMKMKNLRSLFLCLFFFGTAINLAQETKTEPVTVKKTATLKIDKSNIKVKKHTVMSQFEPDLVVSADKRMEKKQKRVAETELKLRILDTLDISESKKRKLLRDLKYAPYSDRLNKATSVADTKFNETTENNQ